MRTLEEIWEVVEEFPNNAVSNFGRVEDIDKKRLVPTRLNKQGFVIVTVRDDMNRQHTRSVALLVAHAFVPSQDVTYFNSVIHLNGDREDCRAMNLMWRTRAMALRYHRMFEEEPLRVSVRIPETGEWFSSLRELCTTYGLVEDIAYSQMGNGTPCWPYDWHIERSQE